MSLTIQEALQLEVFQDTQVVAGHSGLGRRITWVNILEVLDEIDLLQEGDLLVTTAFGLAENVEWSQSLMAQLAKRKLAGLAIQTGYYMQEIPESLIQQANEHGLPLLLLPKNLAFTDLTKAVLRRIVSRQLELLEYSERLHHELTQIVLENQGLDKLALVLAGLVDRTILIFNREFQVEAVSDPLLAQEYGNRSPEAFPDLRKHLIPIPFSTLFQFSGNEVLPPLVLCPILTGRKTYGYIAVLGTTDLKEQEMIALSHGTTVCALVMLKDIAVSEAEARIRGDFLDDLLNGSLPSEEALIRRAEAVGYDVNKGYALAVIDIDPFRTDISEPTETDSQHVKRKLLAAVNRLLSSRGYRHMAKMKRDAVVLLLQSEPSNGTDFYQRMTQFLHSELRKALQGLTISIGVSRPYRNLQDIPKSYEEADKALRIARLVWQQNAIAFYADLGIYRFLLSADPNELRILYEETALPLVEQDEKHKGELVRTAEVYLRSHGNIKEAAAELFIHRHTLRYRLQRIEAILGLDLDRADERLRLQLGLVARYLL